MLWDNFEKQALCNRFQEDTNASSFFRPFEELLKIPNELKNSHFEQILSQMGQCNLSSVVSQDEF